MFGKAALVFALIGVGFVAVWLSKSNIPTLSGSKIRLVDIPKIDWQRACFAPAYHILNPIEFEHGRSLCWNGEEVPEGWTYLTFYSLDGSCERYRFQANFLTSHGADYRCFPKNENLDIQITISDSVLSLQ